MNSVEDTTATMSVVEEDWERSWSDEYEFLDHDSRHLYWVGFHEKREEIPSEAQVPMLSVEIRLKECDSVIGIDMEFRRRVETFSNQLCYFLRAETSRSLVAEMVSQMNLHPDCVESITLKISHIVKEAHELGKKNVHIVAYFRILIVPHEEDEEDEDDEEEEMAPASKSSVEALERRTFKKGESDEIKCTICLNEFSIGKEVICMPCSHIFDSECIIQWLEMNHVCPLCRFQMPQQSEVI